MSEWFLVNVALIQGWLMSPWLFIVYIDDVVREVNTMVLGKGRDVNGGSLEINQLLFEDDTALVVDSEEKLCILDW